MIPSKSLFVAFAIRNSSSKNIWCFITDFFVDIDGNHTIFLFHNFDDVFVNINRPVNCKFHFTNWHSADTFKIG